MTSTTSELWIVIVNWKRFQHYHDRSVPWIKFYTELTHDDAWRDLSLNRRGILCGLWLEYTMSRARLRVDTRSISHRLNGRVTMADLEALQQAGFIELSSRPSLDSVYTESRPTRARVEREEEEIESKGRSRSKTTPPARPEMNGLPVEKQHHVLALIETIGTDADEGTLTVVRSYASRLPISALVKAKESLETKKPPPRNRAKYAVGVLNSEQIELLGYSGTEPA